LADRLDGWRADTGQSRKDKDELLLGLL
jgi:hypothetical protein